MSDAPAASPSTLPLAHHRSPVTTLSHTRTSRLPHRRGATAPSLAAPRPSLVGRASRLLGIPSDDDQVTTNDNKNTPLRPLQSFNKPSSAASRAAAVTASGPPSHQRLRNASQLELPPPAAVTHASPRQRLSRPPSTSRIPSPPSPTSLASHRTARLSRNSTPRGRAIGNSDNGPPGSPDSFAVLARRGHGQGPDPDGLGSVGGSSQDQARF